MRESAKFGWFAKVALYYLGLRLQWVVTLKTEKSLNAELSVSLPELLGNATRVMKKCSYMARMQQDTLDERWG
jgi:hypothetical protein